MIRKSVFDVHSVCWTLCSIREGMRGKGAHTRARTHACSYTHIHTRTHNTRTHTHTHTEYTHTIHTHARAHTYTTGHTRFWTHKEERTSWFLWCISDGVLSVVCLVSQSGWLVDLASPVTGSTTRGQLEVGFERNFAACTLPFFFFPFLFVPFSFFFLFFSFFRLWIDGSKGQETKWLQVEQTGAEPGCNGQSGGR